MAKKRQYPEQKMQIAIFTYLRDLMALQGYKKFMCYHPANGGHRSKAAGAKFKAMGVVAGVADFVFLFNGGKSVYVELKHGKGKQEDPQEWFEKTINGLGYEYYLLAADSESEGVTKIQEFLRKQGVSQ